MSDPLATPLPHLRRRDALTTLRDFALVTYDVEPARLAALLPKSYGFEPDIVTLRDGRERALVSAVNFRDIDFRFVGAQWMRASFVQTNYRAYVRRGAERSVWFFGTTLSSRLAVLPRTLWGMPWHRVNGTLDARWEGEHCVSYESTQHRPVGQLRAQRDGIGPTSSGCRP